VFVGLKREYEGADGDMLRQEFEIILSEGEDVGDVEVFPFGPHQKLREAGSFELELRDCVE
jgi:hypothetical protein